MQHQQLTVFLEGCFIEDCLHRAWAALHITVRRSLCSFIQLSSCMMYLNSPHRSPWFPQVLPLFCDTFLSHRELQFWRSTSSCQPYSPTVFNMPGNGASTCPSSASLYRKRPLTDVPSFHPWNNTIGALFTMAHRLQQTLAAKSFNVMAWSPAIRSVIKLSFFWCIL